MVTIVDMGNGSQLRDCVILSLQTTPNWSRQFMQYSFSIFFSDFFKVAVEIFILTFILASVKTSEIKPIKGITGNVVQLKFEDNSNAYGIEYTLRKSFLFKLDQNKNILWKIEIEKIQSSKNFRKVEIPEYNILINHQNDLYLTIERDEEIKKFYDVYKLDIHKGYTLSKTIFTSCPGNWTWKLGSSFIVYDKIIIAEHLFKIHSGPTDKTPKSVIKVLKVKSGEQFTIASTSESTMTFSIVQDMKEDIYFIKKDVCHIEKFKFGAPCLQQLVVLTKDAVRKENFKLINIDGVIDSPYTEMMFDLKVGNQNELYVGIYDYSSSPRYKIKKFVDRKLKSVFSQPAAKPDIDGFALFVPRDSDLFFRVVRNGLVIKNWKISGENKTGFVDVEINFTYLNENDSIIPMHSSVHMVNREAVTKGSYYCDYLSSLCYRKNYEDTISLEDKQGNIYFGNSDITDPLLLFFNRTTQNITRIQFEPRLRRLDNTLFNTKFLFDENENLWILFYLRMQRALVGPYSSTFVSVYLPNDQVGLYFLKRGTFTARKIPDTSDGVYEIMKNRNDIFIFNGTGLYHLN